MAVPETAVNITTIVSLLTTIMTTSGIISAPTDTATAVNSFPRPVTCFGG